MASNCHVCECRKDAVTAWPAAPSQLDVCVVTLVFKNPVTQTQPDSHLALNTLLNNIVDDAESTPTSSTFTTWSPCLTDPKIVVIVTTVREVCDTAVSSIFSGVGEYLASPPNIQHIYLDLAVLSLAASSSEQRIACDIVQLYAPDLGVAAAIGEQLDWDPKRSPLSTKIQSCPSTTFGRPGDLMRDFWAWAEVSRWKPGSRSTSTGSNAISSPSLLSLSSNEKEKHASLPTPEDKQQLKALDEETLIMIFQWTSHTDGDRFKDYNQTSYGPNGEEVRNDLWYSEIARPIGHLQRLGAKFDTYKLELRAVEPRLHCDDTTASSGTAVRERRRSKCLSIIASELGEKVSRLWR